MEGAAKTAKQTLNTGTTIALNASNIAAKQVNKFT